jgi:XRE family transcriptional regulator, regulator of sulfur utilization
MSSIGDNVKKRRKIKRLNQTELAESAGVTQAMISKLEGGDDNPKIDTLRSIAAALGCSVVDLLPDEDKRRSHSK